MNTITITGYLCDAPKMGKTKDGKAVANCRIAVRHNESETDFFNVTVWDKLGEVVGKYLKKGSHVLFNGQLRTRSYTNKEGTKVIVQEIVANNVEFLDRIEKSEPKRDESVVEDIPF